MLCAELTKCHQMHTNEGDPTFTVVVKTVLFLSGLLSGVITRHHLLEIRLMKAVNRTMKS